MCGLPSPHEFYPYDMFLQNARCPTGFQTQYPPAPPRRGKKDSSWGNLNRRSRNRTICFLRGILCLIYINPQIEHSLFSCIYKIAIFFISYGKNRCIAFVFILYKCSVCFRIPLNIINLYFGNDDCRAPVRITEQNIRKPPRLRLSRNKAGNPGIPSAVRFPLRLSEIL